VEVGKWILCEWTWRLTGEQHGGCQNGGDGLMMRSGQNGCGDDTYDDEYVIVIVVIRVEMT